MVAPGIIHSCRCLTKNAPLSRILVKEVLRLQQGTLAKTFEIEYLTINSKNHDTRDQETWRHYTE